MAVVESSIFMVKPIYSSTTAKTEETSAPFSNRGMRLFVLNASLFCLLSFAAGAIAFALSYLKTPVFKAEATLIPSEELLGLDQNSALGGLGGLASLVGAGGSGSKDNEAVAVLRSRALIYTYVEANNLLPILFANRWSTADRTWKSNQNSKTPTLEDAYILFDETLRTVVENRKTGLTTISVTYNDPKLAKEWVDGLVRTTNEILRHEAIERSTKRLEYLQSASEKMSIMEVKVAIYKLMENEIKKQMTAVGSIDYAFRVVDPAVIPEYKSAPKRMIYTLFGAVLGGLIWLLIVASRGQLSAVGVKP